MWVCFAGPYSLNSLKYVSARDDGGGLLYR